jgi:hypothetical protein
VRDDPHRAADHEVRRPAPQLAVRSPPAEQREQSQRESRLGRHRDAPAGGGRAPEVEREVDGRGAHAADRRQQREHEPPALAKVAEVELATRLQTQHEEEERHQPAVHPLAQRQLDPVAVEVDREHGLPQLLVGRGPNVHPHERRRRRCEQDRRAAALDGQELAQRALEPARPSGCLRPEVRAVVIEWSSRSMRPQSCRSSGGPARKVARFRRDR